MQMEHRDWRAWLAPLDPPTDIDRCWLALAATGMTALAVLLVTFFMIH
jgi:hypothetical protein